LAEAVTKNFRQVWWNAANAPWLLKQDPFRVAPHVYFVGNSWVGVYLLDGGDELALIDTAIFEDVYQVVESIWELGFDPRRIKKILLTHCHIDHSGGVNQLKSISGAEVWQSAEDCAFMNHPANLSAGNSFKLTEYEVDKHFSDDTVIEVGKLKVTSKLTPGHTPGTTSFFIEDYDDSGKKYIVGMHGGVGPNTMGDEYFEKYGMDKNLRQRFIDDCEKLKSIHVDIALPSHPAHGDLLNRKSNDPMDYTPLVNPEEWSKFLEIRKGFAEALNK